MVPLPGGLEPAVLKAWKEKSLSQQHLENFFDAVRAGDPTLLNCPPDVAYSSTKTLIDTVRIAEEGE